MSHRATNWAIGQRGLKPATKIVLWHLADAHNPHHGCFPRQETLAEACEMSRSTVNLHLKALEDGGLIRRIQSRCEQTNRQKATRYLLAFEIDEDQTQDVVSPCPEFGHGNGADSVSDTGAEPCPKNGESRVRNSDSMNPVREPVREPVNQRERAGADVEAGPTDQHPDVVDAPPAPTDDPAKFEKRVKALGKGAGSAHGEWHGWLGGSIRWAVTQFGRLTDAERAEAERCRDAYLGECARQGVKPVPLGVYFRDRKWTDLSDSAVERAKRTATNAARSTRLPEGHAPPFGPVWSAFWVGQVMAGPERKGVDLPETPLPVHFRAAWPSLMAIGYAAQRRKGQVFAPRWHAMAEAMEAVPAGSDLARAWQALFADRRWPWFPRADGMEVVYLPKTPPGGNPDAALAAFAEALETATRTDGATGDDREA